MALDKLVDSTALDGALTATANAIRTKGGTSAQIAFDASTGFATAVAALPSGGGGEPVEEDDVNFFDYDGTLVASYSATDFASLSALPSNPSHSGLTAQGWNWSLSDAKTYVAAYGVLDIGQMYTTDDGTTRLYCRFDSPRLSPYIRLYPNGSVTVDWGDESIADTITGTSLTVLQGIAHTYANAGDYVITLTPTSGSAFAIRSNLLSKNDTASSSENRVYLSCIKKIELGANVSFGDYALENCCALETINIPTTVTAIPQYSFQYCNKLCMFVVPTSVTSLGGRQVFEHCSSLTHIAIPNNVTSIGRATFDSCVSLLRVTSPTTLTSLGISAFNLCHSLKKVLIPGVTSMSGNNVFTSCYCLDELVFPSGITSFGNYVFSGCIGLKKITFPDTIKTFGTYCVQICYSLQKLIIPSTATTFGNYCFRDAYGLKEIHFLPTAPPTANDANVFINLPTDCTIYVPTGKLNDYKAATNYPDPNTYTYVEE